MEWYREVVNGFETAVKDNDETFRLFRMSPTVIGVDLPVLQVYPDNFEPEANIRNHKFLEQSSEFLMRSKAGMTPKILRDGFNPQDLKKWEGEPCKAENVDNG